MIKRIAAALKTTPLALALVFFFGLSYAYASWTAPTATPPNGNTPTPINVGSTAQTKAGPLTLGGTLTVPQGNSLTWSGTGNYLYSDTANTAIRQAGAFFVQNPSGTAQANVVANDVYLTSIGKWASQLGGGTAGVTYAGTVIRGAWYTATPTIVNTTGYVESVTAWGGGQTCYLPAGDSVNSVFLTALTSMVNGSVVGNAISTPSQYNTGSGFISFLVNPGSSWQVTSYPCTNVYSYPSSGGGLINVMAQTLQ